MSYHRKDHERTASDEQIDIWGLYFLLEFYKQKNQGCRSWPTDLSVLCYQLLNNKMKQI